MSHGPGRSTLITSAPSQASNWVQVGPDWTCVKSRILTPSSALPSLPHGLLETFGALATSFSAGFFAGLALALTFVLPLAFFATFFAIVCPLCTIPGVPTTAPRSARLWSGRRVGCFLLLLELALRVE